MVLLQFGPTEAQATKRRLQVQLLMTVSGSTVDSSTGSIAAGGLQFENGTDGTVNTARSLPMYNSANNLEADRDYLNGQISLAYQGAMVSVDGSIEQLPECVYPWVISGAYISNDIMKILLIAGNPLEFNYYNAA